MGLLESNASTDYGRDHNFAQMTSVDDFRYQHPLTRYDHYTDYVRRIYMGEQNVMTSTPVRLLAMTSGTSGVSRMIPYTDDVKTTFFKKGITSLYHVLAESFPDFDRSVQKTCKLVVTPHYKTSPGRLMMGPNSSTKDDMRRIKFMYTTPLDAFTIRSEPHMMYVHLLFALTDRNLGAIEANFAQVVCIAVDYLHEMWPRLVQDICVGSIDSDIVMDPVTRKKLENQLRANPARANELAREFSSGFDGILKRIWPNLRFVLTVDTGTSFGVSGGMYCTMCYIFRVR